MKRFISIIALFVCAIFIMAACESSEQSPSQSQQSGGQQSGGQQSQGQQQQSGQQQTPQIKPKQLISKEDAAKILGESLKEGAEEDVSDFPGMSICFYAPEKSDSKSYLMIALLQKQQQSGGQQSQGQQQSGGQSSSGGQQSGGQQSGGQQQMSPEKVFKTLKKVFSDPNKAVTGFIGDDKFMMSQGMSILSGENVIFISVGSADPSKAQDLLKKASELAVGNLKRILGQ